MKTKSDRTQALTPKKRLLHSWEYRRFFNQSSVFRLSECIIFRIPNDLGHFRLGITLKAKGSSVDRNKTKRQIREAFRRRAPLLGSFDYNVVIPASKKLAHPYSRQLGLCFRNELNRVLGIG
ncbi:MAG TPA: ribonuclease P protein component [Bdellovibrionales bacterium]|nr:ribonuclease P protein component [Bdellovibrionales bacterium]HCM40724.1 ribonuclease P protein component [Bdellovibrionales bacterium]